MKVLSHRGFWRSAAERNSAAAFHRTIAEGFGTETDFRDRNGRLVIAHDPATEAALPAEEVVAAFAGTGLTLAVNVKADGLTGLLAELFRSHNVPWFAFDMSGPETWRYANAGLPFMTRHSDLEPQPILYGQALGVWLDAFADDWFDAAVIEQHLSAGKQVCVVSPELHGRDNRPLWDLLDPLAGRAGLMLCTDLPDQARGRFG